MCAWCATPLDAHDRGQLLVCLTALSEAFVDLLGEVGYLDDEGMDDRPGAWWRPWEDVDGATYRRAFAACG